VIYVFQLSGGRTDVDHAWQRFEQLPYVCLDERILVGKVMLSLRAHLRPLVTLEPWRTRGVPGLVPERASNLEAMYIRDINLTDSHSSAKARV
jgi:hypothetical protein